MRLYHAIFVLLSILAVSGTIYPWSAQASDVNWIFGHGYYTHSPETGERVAQYEPERPSIVPADPTYQESGYRHQVVQDGNDRLNLVQTWGAGTAIRPYGEWEYPYCAGATPFGPWGNPQGPWTLPFDSWRNPYGLNRPGHHLPMVDGPTHSGYESSDAEAWQDAQPPPALPQQPPLPPPSPMPAPPTAGPMAPTAGAAWTGPVMVLLSFLQG